MGGFEAGYMGDDGFSVTLLVMYFLHLGANVVPGSEPHKGAFDLTAFAAAFARGRQLNRDLRYWDAWEAMHLPLAAARELIGLSAE